MASKDDLIAILLAPRYPISNTNAEYTVLNILYKHRLSCFLADIGAHDNLCLIHSFWQIEGGPWRGGEGKGGRSLQL